VSALAGVRHPEAVAFLKRMKEERHRGLYWAATAALAVGGDEASSRELGRLLLEDRTMLFYYLINTLPDTVMTLGGQQRWVRHWTTRLNTNCCLSYHAYNALKAVFPTIPVHQPGTEGDPGNQGAFARAWLDRHAGRFERSEILNGLVPAK
jgi:hypothetical protein